MLLVHVNNTNEKCTEAVKRQLTTVRVQRHQSLIRIQLPTLQTLMLNIIMMSAVAVRARNISLMRAAAMATDRFGLSAWTRRGLRIDS